jgi:hypothetical protein
MSRTIEFTQGTIHPTWGFIRYAEVTLVEGGGPDYELDWLAWKSPFTSDYGPDWVGERNLFVRCRPDWDPPCTVDEDFRCEEGYAYSAEYVESAVGVTESGVFAGSWYEWTEIAGWILDLPGVERVDRLTLRGTVTIVEAYGLSRLHYLVIERLLTAPQPDVCGDRENWLPWMGVAEETLPPPAYERVLDPSTGGAVELARVPLVGAETTVFPGQGVRLVPVDVPCPVDLWREIGPGEVLRVRLDPLVEPDPQWPVEDGHTALVRARFSFYPDAPASRRLWLEGVEERRRRPLHPVRTWTARQVLARNSLR